ncbi:MAG TPA: MarR family transcriptional regulator [Jatrophihabitans sp.]|nr:MarR family transcriptional regulator [Jatrophihabitans sp.]
MTERDDPTVDGAAAPEPRWLTGDEQCAWRSFIEGVRSLIDALDRQLQVDSALPHAYFEVLVPLSEAPDQRLRMSELASSTRSSRSRLSHAVSRLEERGWVRRVDCPTDKRGQLAILTAEGMDVVRSAAPGHAAAVRRYLIDRLTPEQLRALGEIGRVMLDSTSACAQPPRPV